jgi:hypothetical protein
MAFHNQQEPTVYTLGIPELDGKEGYVASFYQRFKEIGTVLSTPEFYREPIRVNLLCELTISEISGEEQRRKVREKAVEIYNELCRQKKEETTKELTESERAECALRASIRTLGYVTDYVDKMVGLAEENKIGFVRAP